MISKFLARVHVICIKRFVAVLVLTTACLQGARASQAIITLTPSPGISLPAPAQPGFTLTASLPNPDRPKDSSGNTWTAWPDTLVRLEILENPWSSLGVVNVINNYYSAPWFDPRGALNAGTRTYTVRAMGNHYEIGRTCVSGYWQENGHWESGCREVEDGYWDDGGNWVVEGSHEECGDLWVEDEPEWIDGYCTDFLITRWVSFGEANVSFYITTLQGRATLTPYNGATSLASPAQPKFTISASLSNARTVTDGLGNTKSDTLTFFQIYNPNYGWFPNLAANGTTQTSLWADPRSGLDAGTQQYSVYSWAVRWDAYDYGWVDGHWDQEGYWDWRCEDVEDGYWDSDGNWVVEGSHQECGDTFIATSSQWVDGFWDTGFTSTVELISRQDITFTISTGTPQVITFPSVGTRSWGEPPFPLLATASSGLPVVYAVSSGPATVAGNMLTVTGTGSVTVIASQPGNSTYSEAIPVSQTFSVVAGQSQTTTFPPIANRTFGDPPFSLVATASSGLPVSYVVASGAASVLGSTVTIAGGGSVTITAIQSGNATYQPAAPVSQTFTVAKGAQTIEFATIPNMAEGDAPFPLSAVATSFLPISFTVLAGPATVSGNMLTVTGPGTVTVRASQNGDYRFLAASSVDRTFNVGLGPNGHTLTVENGTAGAIGGNRGASINLTANIPAGQYFAGWVIVAGDGYIMDVANPSTTFTMGGIAATVRATYTSSAPSYGFSWTQFNAPSSVTANDSTTFSYATLDYGAMMTNIGTAPLPRATFIEVVDASNQIVGFGMFVNGVSGIAVGQTAPIWFISIAPNTAGTYSFGVRVRTVIGGALVQIGQSLTTSTSVTARTGTPPQIQMPERYFLGTVGNAFSIAASATNLPTYSVIGTLPPNVTLNSATGEITGIPTQAGVYAPTLIATNSSGRHAVGLFFRIYANEPYLLSVTGGVASASKLTVGASANLEANFPPSGQIFNGWSVVNGVGAFTDWRSTTTSVKLNAPGDLAVQSNFLRGNPLVVIGGTASPMGGTLGAAVTLTAGPDGDGTMFGNWTTSGPGTIAAAGSQNTTFTMGAAPATVTANFVPGYRLNLYGGSASATGGLLGTEINVWPGGSPGTGYSFEGFWLEGPGYLIGNSGRFVMGAGAARLHAGWWPTGSGPLTRSLLQVDSATNVLSLYKGEPFTICMYTDFPTSTGLMQQIDYSTDGGNSWQGGVRRPPDLSLDPDPEGKNRDKYRWRIKYTKQDGFATPGRVIFRARADTASMSNPIYFYLPLTVHNIEAATFLTHPSSIEVIEGQRATFQFSAKGNGGYDFLYQWRKNGMDIFGQSGLAPSDTLIKYEIDKGEPGQAGVYTVAIKSGAADKWISSNEATLTVQCTSPEIMVQPNPESVTEGQPASFSVVAGGAGELTYQWRKNGTAITGATLARYTITSSQFVDVGTYSVIVANRCESVVSRDVTLTVGAAGPAITAPPAAAVVVAGSSATFAVGVSGTAPFAYQWRKNSASIAGATGASYTIPAAQLGDAGYYDVVVSNTAGVTTSSKAVLVVNSTEGNGAATIGNTLPSSWPTERNTVDTTETRAVGSTRGELSVDKNGAAVYSIPIWVSPGTAGMEPKLTLNYSSQAGPGIAGWGWSIGGISAISRGPQTHAVDGQVKGVGFTYTDRYYLDGQRLIAINGTDGVSGTEYRTEIDSFSKIVSYDSAGQGPGRFKVWTKAGLIMEYGDSTGASSDSALNPGSRLEILSWSLKKISDTSGNSIRFEYSKDTATGEQLVSAIRYTERSDSGYYASVVFDYEPRTDTASNYIAGALVSRTQRLKRIKSCYGAAPGNGKAVRTYELSYTERQNTMRSLLTQIEEIGVDGKKYPALTFTYDSPSQGWAASALVPPVALAEDNAASRGTGFVDLDGDGRPDFVRFHRWGTTGVERDAWLQLEGAWALANGTVEGVPDWRLPIDLSDDYQPVLAWDTFADFGTRFVDLDGDGRVDLIHGIKRGGTTYSAAYLNNGAGWTRAPQWDMPAGSYLASEGDQKGSSRLIDVNGDGRVDVVWNYDASNKGCLLNTGSGWASNTAFAPPIKIDGSVIFIDVNGDGLPDQLQHWFGSGAVVRGVALNNGTGWQSLAAGTTDFDRFVPRFPISVRSPNGGDFSPVGAESVDLNGDGLMDLVWNNPAAGYIGAYLNSGAGWIAAPAAYLPKFQLMDNNTPVGSALMDVNGDGIVDQVVSKETNSNGEAGVYLGTGRGWTDKLTTTQFNLPYFVSRFEAQRSSGMDFVDLDGDGVVDQVWRIYGGASGARRNASKAADRLQKVTNGFGVSAVITYAPLTARDGKDAFAVYDRDVTRLSDAANIIAPLFVVENVSHDDGAGGQYHVTYRYGQLRSHRLRGSLGFAWMTVTDGRTAVASTTTYSQVFPTIGMPTSSRMRSGTTDLSDSLLTYADKTSYAGRVHAVVTSRTLTHTREIGQGNDTYVTAVDTYIPDTSTDVDGYGNIKKLIVDSLDGFKKTTVSTYSDNASAWIIGRLVKTKVTSEAPGQASIMRTTAYRYDSATGLLVDEAIEPVFNAETDAIEIDYTKRGGYGLNSLRTHYDYDAYGNKTAIRVTGRKSQVAADGTVTVLDQLETRTTSTSYDARGRFAASSTNAAGHTEYYADYDQELGVLKKLKGPNRLETSWLYDGFGQKTRENRADGTATNIWVRWVGSQTTVPGGGKYLIETESTGLAPSIAFHDAFGRVIRTLSIDGNAKIISHDTEFDGHGRPWRKSNPYHLDGLAPTIYWTEVPLDAKGQRHYDVLNRPLSVRTPDDGMKTGYVTTSYSYDGMVTTVTDPKSRLTQTTRNSQGWVVSTIRNKSAGASAADYGAVSYVYDALGNPIETVAAGVTTKLEYDARGRKSSMDDPDMGSWQYRYNAFGELIWQKDANGQIATLTYDALGRLVSRAEPEGTTNWTYDTAARENPPEGAPTTWLGRITSTTAPGGYEESYAYDAYGRVKTVARTIDGGSYAVSQTYDNAGRPERTIYPTNFQTRNVYNTYGFLKEVRRADNGRSDLYWQADRYDVSGRVDGETAGNGVANYRAYSAATGRLTMATVDQGFVINAPYAIQHLTYAYDAVGNVRSRFDAATGRDERFSFDNDSDGYDGLDRLRVHRRIGGPTVTVGYDQKGNISSKSDVGDYTYNYTPVGRDNALPHAVSIAGSASYTYDANGGMLGGAGRTIKWTSFNQLKRAEMADGKFSEFSFGADRARVKQTSHLGTTLYVGGLYEKFTRGSLTEHKHYIMAPTGRIAVRVERSNATEETRYFHSDGLGSITCVTDEVGGIVKRFAFDPWGKRVDPDTNSVVTSVNSGGFTRGFTDHEHLDDLGLIHMNGRVYDPVLGRFLSADPYVGGDDSQEYSRYSYISNNPLGGTDPSGYFKLSLGSIAKIVAVVVVAYFTAGAAIAAWGASAAPTSLMIASGGTITSVGASAASSAMLSAGLSIAATNGIIGGLAGGFASGFAGSLLNGGSIGDAFKAGAIGGVSGGVSGGIAGAFSNAGIVTRTAATSVLGGATSEAMGGNFKDGALIAGAVTLGNYGWQRARDFTDDNAAKAARTAEAEDLRSPQGTRVADELRVTDPNGVVRTDGTVPIREGATWGPKWLDRAFRPIAKLVSGPGMARQGSDLHFYDHARWTGGQDGWDSQFINRVSKLHDWFNGWGYHSATGYYVSHGAAYDTAFTMYSFSGMVPAAAITASVLSDPSVTVNAYTATRR